MIARWWNGSIAVLVLAAMVLQIWIVIRLGGAPSSGGLGDLRGTGLPGRLLRLFSFFTIESNILAGVSSALLMRSAASADQRWPVLRVDALYGITLTGLVYSIVLAPLHDPKGWQDVTVNTLLHYIVPTLMVLGWLLFGPRPQVTLRVLLLALAWPLAWVTWTLIHGELSGWYPYGFVDAATHGYVRVALNMVAVVGVTAVMFGLLWWGDRRLPVTKS